MERHLGLRKQVVLNIPGVLTGLDRTQRDTHKPNMHFDSTTHQLQRQTNLLRVGEDFEMIVPVVVPHKRGIHSLAMFELHVVAFLLKKLPILSNKTKD